MRGEKHAFRGGAQHTIAELYMYSLYRGYMCCRFRGWRLPSDTAVTARYAFCRSLQGYGLERSYQCRCMVAADALRQPCQTGRRPFAM